MRRTAMVLTVALLTITSCGGGDDDAGDDPASGSVDDGDAGGDGDGDEGGFSDEAITGQSPNFDLATLPANFPSELVPPDWGTGQYTDITGFPTATFESNMAFDDALAYYDGVHGPHNILVGDPGERLAQWTMNPPWIVSILEEDPLLIGISEVPEE